MDNSIPGHTSMMKGVLFLAPTGAQEVTLSICPSVPTMKSWLEQSIFIFLGQRDIKQSKNTQGALREHSESTQRAIEHSQH